MHPRHVLLVAALLIATVYGIATGADDASPSTGAPHRVSSPEGFWRGSGHTKRIGNLDWIQVISEYHTNFWFTVDGSGNVDGYAVVTYDIALDDRRLSGALAWANAASNSAVNLLPGIGSVLGANVALSEVVGMRTSYEEPLAVRAGTIGGRLNGSRLELYWAEQPAEIPFTTYRVYPMKEEVISRGSTPAYSPWNAPGITQEVAPGQWQAIVTPIDAQQAKGNGKVAISAFWQAYQVAGEVH